eukprot:5606332-Amphidinium_carterae.1
MSRAAHIFTQQELVLDLATMDLEKAEERSCFASRACKRNCMSDSQALTVRHYSDVLQQHVRNARGLQAIVDDF